MQANSSADVMVDLVQHGPAFEDFLRKFGPEAKLLVDDLSKYIQVINRSNARKYCFTQ
jgi:hypothetical protein